MARHLVESVPVELDEYEKVVSFAGIVYIKGLTSALIETGQTLTVPVAPW